jgi:putative glutamine amidotransferase
MKQLVGVTLRVVEAPTYYELRDAISHDWIRFLTGMRAAPLLIPNSPSCLPQLLEQISVSALLLTGGNNVGTLEPDGHHGSTEDEWVERDTTEQKVIEFALQHDVPLLGVCRGMQVLNVFFGGEIVRDLAELGGGSEDHVATTHEIEFVDPSWRKRLGTSSAITNSFHKQAVTLPTLSSKLRALALSGDGVVEALYHPDHRIVGIQWHPERDNLANDVDRILMDDWLGRDRNACIW